jgi:tetratricopeptide (TPR) repeat protein
MRLTTLGGLELDGSDFARTKPLLLLAYLSLEGSGERRFLSELFWPDAADKRNSLSRAISQLRKGAPGAIDGDETRVWTPLQSDAQDFRARAQAGDGTGALALYRGAFLTGITPSEWGLEIEEWVLETREALAALAQEALLGQAEAAAARGAFVEAGGVAARAFALDDAPEPEPEALMRYHTLLVAADHRLADRVRSEAEGYGIDLRLAGGEARSRLQTALLGRERERELLSGLAPGAWAWLHGGVGMGKTALLESLQGTLVQGRSGLPFATLEPLLGSALTDGALEEGGAGVLRRLAGESGTWLLDGWEESDPESQALLRRLRDLRPQLRVIVASREPAALRVDRTVELDPLDEHDLEQHPGLYDATGGLPALVGAALRGEPLDDALEARLNALSPAAADTYLALVLGDGVDPPLVRRALALGASEMAGALEELQAAGLVAGSGRPRATAAAREVLDGQPVLAGRLALALARQRRGVEAFPLYERARLLWEDDDLDAARDAYLAWARELLRRGFAERAGAVLEAAPPSPEVTLLRARALERSGHFRAALERLDPLDETPEVLALRGLLLLRLGRPADARAAAERALDGNPEARAEALNTLGHLARGEGQLRDAARYASRAAAVWRSLGQQARWAGALLNRATAEALLGEDTEESFRDALEAAGDNALLRARALLNLGWTFEREQRTREAEDSYREAAQLGEEMGALTTAARAWNNVGVLHHKGGRSEPAQEAYERALALAQQAGEQRMLGMFMANLAELTGDGEAWREALRILDRSGNRDAAETFRNDLPADHPFHSQPGDRA